MTDWLKANKKVLLMGALIIMALGVNYFFPQQKDNSVNETEAEWEKAEDNTPKSNQGSNSEDMKSEKDVKILIDVKGAVVNQGVYEANPGERVIDVITKAGGLLETADKNNINFALKVVDEMVLYIPAVGEQSQVMTAAPTVTGTSSSLSSQTDKVNLNTATETDLQTLPGIGPSKAASIIEYRDTNGPFKKIEDLMEISGIGEKTFEKLKDSILVQ